MRIGNWCQHSAIGSQPLRNRPLAIGCNSETRPLPNGKNVEVRPLPNGGIGEVRPLANGGNGEVRPLANGEDGLWEWQWATRLVTGSRLGL